MYITKIKLVNFRNYEKLNLQEIGQGLQVVYGKNAQGKTNLIEAIHICANGKSFRVSGDAKTIGFGGESAYILVEYVRGGRKNTMEALIEKYRKSFKVNGLPVKNIKDMLGNLLVVVFSPEDLKTAKESPGLRRAFLDGEISKIRPSYVDALKKYSSIIAQKNALLRRRNSTGIPDLLAAYNDQLAGYIKIILKNRISYVKKLNDFVKETHLQISGGSEKIEIKYRAGIVQENVAAQLERLMSREIEDFACNTGPHRDDLDIRVNDKDVKSYASQGQLRTLMLAIKLACLKILEESAGHKPILLLDDVFSELDELRKQNLLRQLCNMQTFLTTAQQIDASELPQTSEILVKNGHANLKKL